MISPKPHMFGLNVHQCFVSYVKAFLKHGLPWPVVMALLFLTLVWGCSSKPNPTASLIPSVANAVAKNAIIAAPNYFTHTNGCTSYVTNGVVAWTSCHVNSYGQFVLTAYFSVPDGVLTLEPDAGPPHSMMATSMFDQHVWTEQAVYNLGDPWQDMVSITNAGFAEVFTNSAAHLEHAFYRVKYQ